MFEEMRKAIEAATRDSRKMAMFHFQVLSNATDLEAVDAEEFCRAVGVAASYNIEFRKMLALARLIREQGLQLS